MVVVPLETAERIWRLSGPGPVEAMGLFYCLWQKMGKTETATGRVLSLGLLQEVVVLQEKPLFIEGPAGRLESLYLDVAEAGSMALLCHPHPLYGGTMNNKVISTLQRIARDSGLVTLRFNFRGVGASEGEYGEGEGEIGDAFAAASWLLDRHPGLPFFVLGFSFGSCVAACMAGQLEQQGMVLQRLVMIAPPVERFSVEGRLPQRCPLTIIQPMADEVVSADRVYAWSYGLSLPHELIKVAKCSHFFHGRLTDLKALIAPRLSH